MKALDTIIPEINGCFRAFQQNAEVLRDKGNKSAGMRARKVSSQIALLMKEFRKLSVAATKEA